jgi:hypothetical protein
MSCGDIRNSDWKFQNRKDHGKIIDPDKKSLASSEQVRSRLGKVGLACGFCQNLYVTYHCDIPEFRGDR